MRNRLASKRSKYLFALGLIAISIGFISKKVITYPKGCQPINNMQMSYLFKI